MFVKVGVTSLTVRHVVGWRVHEDGRASPIVPETPQPLEDYTYCGVSHETDDLGLVYRPDGSMIDVTSLKEDFEADFEVD